HPPFQDRRARLLPAGRRGVPPDRGAEGRARLLLRVRRHAAALADEGALALVREPAGTSRHGAGQARRGRHRGDRQHRHRARGDRSVSPTNSPTSHVMPAAAAAPVQWSDRAQQDVAEALARYPVKRSAVLPVLWIAQREWGWISPPALKLVAE